MKRFIEGEGRGQGALFTDRLDNWIDDDNAVRAIDVFVDELELGGLGFGRVEPQPAGRPGYHPSVLLKLYIYGCLNRVQSSRRLELFADASVAIDGAKFKAETQRLKELAARMRATPDPQTSLSDPDARSMATSGRGSGIVSYHVQAAADTPNII